MDQDHCLLDLHTHTIASSHAYSTIYEYIQEAKRRAIKMIGCSDHGTELIDGADHHWHFANMKCIPSFIDGVIVLKGIEGNIREDGTTDCYDEYKNELDYMMAGFHAPLYNRSSNIAHNTDSLVKVMSSGFIDIITHPANKFYPIDHKTIVACAKEYNVALEINSSNFSRRSRKNELLQLDLINLACEYKVPLIIGSDAHCCYNLGDFALAYRLLDEAGCPRNYVLNSSPRKVLDFLISRNHKSAKKLLKYCD